jgi:hypothetical protein
MFSSYMYFANEKKSVSAVLGEGTNLSAFRLVEQLRSELVAADHTRPIHNADSGSA